jgi:hypothetical protein
MLHRQLHFLGWAEGCRDPCDSAPEDTVRDRVATDLCLGEPRVLQWGGGAGQVVEMCTVV